VNDLFDIETHFYIITIGFPAIFFCLIVIYLYLKGRYNRRL